MHTPDEADAEASPFLRIPGVADAYLLRASKPQGRIRLGYAELDDVLRGVSAGGGHDDPRPSWSWQDSLWPEPDRPHDQRRPPCQRSCSRSSNRPWSCSSAWSRSRRALKGPKSSSARVRTTRRCWRRFLRTCRRWDHVVLVQQPCTIEQCEALLARARVEGFWAEPLRLVVIDYLGLVGTARRASAYEITSHIARETKNLAKRHQVALGAAGPDQPRGRVRRRTRDHHHGSRIRGHRGGRGLHPRHLEAGITGRAGAAGTRSPPRRVQGPRAQEPPRKGPADSDPQVRPRPCSGSRTVWRFRPAAAATPGHEPSRGPTPASHWLGDFRPSGEPPSWNSSQCPLSRSGTEVARGGPMGNSGLPSRGQTCCLSWSHGRSACLLRAHPVDVAHGFATEAAVLCWSARLTLARASAWPSPAASSRGRSRTPPQRIGTCHSKPGGRTLIFRLFVDSCGSFSTHLVSGRGPVAWW